MRMALALLLLPLPAVAAVKNVSTVAQLQSALASAQAGDEIVLADDTYLVNVNLSCAADGTGTQPITVRAANRHAALIQFNALEGFKAGRYRVLVATDIAARGIDIEELGHVVNFDVPQQAEDYIHRVGRTARAEATGDAFTFVSPEEEGDLRAIERAVGKRLPRVTLPDFDYKAKADTKLEIPLAERIAAIRARAHADSPGCSAPWASSSATWGGGISRPRKRADREAKRSGSSVTKYLSSGREPASAGAAASLMDSSRARSAVSDS